MACEEIREPDTDVKVKSAEIVAQDVAVTVTVSSALSQDGLAGARAGVRHGPAENCATAGDSLNELTHADIIHKIKSDVSTVKRDRDHACGRCHSGRGEVIMAGRSPSQ